MSNVNAGVSSVDEARYNKARNQEDLTALKAQQNAINYQKMMLDYYMRAAKQDNDNLGLITQLVAKNAASNAANNVNWVGHTAAPNMPQFQPRFQGMFSGMLSDPWHQFVYQKEYENRRDRAIANQMDELYRRNQLDQINAAKGNQLDNLIATLMLNRKGTSMPDVGQLNFPQNALDTGLPVDDSSEEVPPDMRGIVERELADIAQSEQDLNFNKINNILKDRLPIKYHNVIAKVFANKAEDQKKFYADPLAYINLSSDGLAAYKVKNGSDGVDLGDSTRYGKYIANNGSSLDGKDREIYEYTRGRAVSHYKELDKNTSGDLNPGDYRDVNGESYNTTALENIGRKFYEYNSANGWTKDQLAAAMATYDLAVGSYRPYNDSTFDAFNNNAGEFKTWFTDARVSDDKLPTFWSNGLKNFNDFFKKYGSNFILAPGDKESWKRSGEKRANAAETLATLGYLKDQGMIKDSVYEAAKDKFSRIYNSPIWDRSTALEFIKKGDGSTFQKNLTELVGPFYKDNKFNPNLNPKEFTDKVINDIDSGLTRDEYIMSDPKYQELFLSDRIEDQEAAKRFLSSTYFYTGKYSNLSGDDLKRKAKWVDNTYVRIKDMLQDRVKQRAAMPNNDIGNGIKGSIDQSFSDNSQTILKNVANSSERKSIIEDFSNLLKHVEGLPSYAYMDGGSSSGRVAILYGVDMKEALRASGVSPEEASKIANDAVKTKKNFGDLDPKYQKAILNYQNKVFQDKWNMSLSSFGVANSQGKRPSSILGIKDPQEARYFDLMVLQANWRGDGPGIRKYLNTISKATFQKEMDTRAKNKSNVAFPYVSAFLDLYKDFANRSKSKYVLLGSNGKGGRIGNIAKFFASKRKS